jgi:hypothetical protein
VTRTQLDAAASTVLAVAIVGAWYFGRIALHIIRNPRSTR